MATNANEVPLLEEIRPAWQRKEMVIALLHARCEHCDAVRAHLARREGLLGDPEVLVLALDDTAPQAVQAPLRRAAGLPDGCAFVVLGNRFLELYAVIEAHSMPVADLMSETLSWVDVMQQRCAECSLDGAEYR
jgi:hypothetical protein